MAIGGELSRVAAAIPVGSAAAGAEGAVGSMSAARRTIGAVRGMAGVLDGAAPGTAAASVQVSVGGRTAGVIPADDVRAIVGGSFGGIASERTGPAGATAPAPGGVDGCALAGSVVVGVEVRFASGTADGRTPAGSVMLASEVCFASGAAEGRTSAGDAVVGVGVRWMVGAARLTSPGDEAKVVLSGVMEAGPVAWGGATVWATGELSAGALTPPRPVSVGDPGRASAVVRA